MSGFLKQQEVARLQLLLSSEQKEFLDNNIKQSKKSKWLTLIGQKKGFRVKSEMDQFILEKEIDDWILADILDGGLHNRPYKCECGHSLRHQFIVKHSSTGEVLKLGDTCLKNYTGLDATLVKDITTRFHSIDLEREEILVKFKNKDFFDIEGYIDLKKSPHFSSLFKQVEIGLPLTDKQIKRLNLAFYKYQSKLKMDNLIFSLTEEQLNIINNLTKWDRDEVLEKLMDEKSIFKVLPDNIKDPEVIAFITNKLPLLDRHNEILFTPGDPFTNNKAKRRASEPPYFNRTYKGITSVHTVEQVTYQQLIDRHLKTLEEIRKNENRLAEGLKQEWLKIQRNIINLKSNQKFDYASFRTNIKNILIMLKIPREIDVHL